MADQQDDFLQKLQSSVAQWQQSMERCKQDIASEKEKIMAEKESIRKEREALLEERRRLEEEREKMTDMRIKMGDIIELNVGGRPFTTTRATLCAKPDTLLASMFSGRWEGGLVRDRNNTVFLDFDPELFAALLSHLRTLQVSPPTTTGGSDSLTAARKGVPEEKQKEWDGMLGYLGFNAPAAAVSALAVFSTDPALTDADTFAVSGDGKSVSVVREQTKIHHFAQVSAVVDRSSAAVHTWKFKVRQTSEFGGRDGPSFGCIGYGDGERPAGSSGVAAFKQAAFFKTGTPSTRVYIKGSTTVQLMETAEAKTGDIVTLTLDARTGTMLFNNAFSCTLPAEWTSFRVCVGAWYVGQGAEILSVE